MICSERFARRPNGQNGIRTPSGVRGNFIPEIQPCDDIRNRKPYRTRKSADAAFGGSDSIADDSPVGFPIRQKSRFSDEGTVFPKYNSDHS